MVLSRLLLQLALLLLQELENPTIALGAVPDAHFRMAGLNILEVLEQNL